MAEFKLGRIRFVWKNVWATGTVYYKDDVIQYGGRLYICVTGHTSAASFYTDLDITPSKWNLVSDGQNWKGDWTTSTSYVYNDIVKYGARLYIANTVHTSAATADDGLEADLAKWDVFGEGLDYKGDWAISTRYRVNDLVKYGGINYVCNTLHTSADNTDDGLESSIANWDEFDNGTDFKGAWTASTRYKKNDIVRFGGNLHICATYHTSTDNFEADESNWNLFVQGIQYENEWDFNRQYQQGDIVLYGGNQYISKQTHGNQTPDDDTDYWELYSKGLNWKGDYGDDSSTQEYRPGDIVKVNGTTYICIDETIGNEPPNALYWEEFSSGFNWRNEWLDDREYKKGDVVRFGENSYVCILAHQSEGDDYSSLGGAQNSRPDLDTSGTYWNIMTIGTETSVLTTKGDMVFYGGSGPTRLPIGEEGQVLRVSSTDTPEWTYFGFTDDVFYVSEKGTDKPWPAAGGSIDNPFRTIRYACEQVEKGVRNADAALLLERNRFFIQRETGEWTDYQIANDLAPFTSAFDYNQGKCERDVGRIIDAVVWDLRHSGNVKSREAALKYVNEPGAFYTLGQGEETVASINYALTVMEKVLEQADPTTNYQDENGDNSTAIVAQYKNSVLEAETGVNARVTSLVKIVTDAITAQDDDDIPPKDDPTYLIRVATGRYKEVLPIIVPANTCIMGDELRSTNVQPKTTTNGATLTSREDTPFSFQALTHMESLVGDIVLGTAITPTTGNTEDQSTVWPYAVGSQSDNAKQLARVIRRRIDWHIGDKLEQELQGINQFSTALTGYARDQILSNKAYLQEEITAWIADTYPTVKYSKTKCKQDIGYIIDALAYDLTYGGNWQSVNAGEAYWQGTSLQIDSSEKTATLAAYERLKTLLQTIIRGFTVTDGSQDEVDQVMGEGGGAADVTTVDGLMDDIIDIITNGSRRVAIVYPSTTNALPQRVVASNDLNNAVSTIKSQVTSFISANFPNLAYNSAKCERDVGYIIDAIRYDLMLETNFASMVVAYSYLRAPSKKVVGDQKIATLAAYEYLRTLCKDNSGQGDGAGEMDNQIDTTIDWTNDMIFSGSAEGGNEHWWEPNLDHAVQQIELNEDFIVEEIHAHVTEYFKDNIIATTNSGNTITVVDSSWMRQWMKVELEGTAIGGLSTSTTYYVRNILDKDTITLSTTKGGSAVSVSDDTGDSSSLTIKAAYTYDKAACTRDIKAYLKAIQWDFIYPADYDREYTNNIDVYLTGCYKTRLAARYYANAVLGSQEEDFYYLRNNTGLRLQTMDGLKGDLLAPNAYGTSRVSAGAYASLDPGWGPKDERVWIKTRSPYVQNCTTFGYAAVGQKIDGALHDGGNDSMVSNDFTQVISDGIGAWLLNNGRAEMVSVFTYYSHIGYLCESGGRARATNGNNSYGDFGSVAEGVDPDETPVTAVVDNKFQYVATMSNSETDGDKVLNVEFSHAGEQYTDAAINIFGGGTNAETKVDEFRDGAVGQVRMLDQNDSSGQLGGKGYLVVQNTAQAGTTTQLTLAATDGNLSTAYPGMLLVLTGGSGVGQYGIIDTYDAGSKVATVTRQSDGVAGWDHFVPGTTIAAPNSSTTYRIEPAISFSTTSASTNGRSFASTANWSDIHFANLSQQYTDVDVSDGSSTTATFDVDRVFSRYFVTLNEPGLGYNRGDVLTILGSSVGGVDGTNDITITISAVTSTGAVRAFDSKGFARTGIYIASTDSSATFNYSYDGTTWTSGTLPGTAPNGATEMASGLIDDGSSDFKPSHIVLAGESGVSNQLWRSTDGVNWTSEAAPGGPYTGAPHVAFGNNLFVVFYEGSRDTLYSSDGGNTWVRTEDALPSTGYTAITHGRETFMAVKSGSTEAAISSDGITWTQITMPSSATWTSITYGQNRHMAIAVDGSAAYTLDDGTNWSAVTLPTGSDYSDIAYGQGNFVATRTGSSTYAYSTHGLVWDTATAQISSATGIDAVTFGNNQADPRFFCATAGSTAIASEIFRPARAFGRAGVANEKIFEVRLLEPGSGYDASSPPTMTITDPNNTYEAPVQVRVFDGALGQPTFTNRGSSYENSSAEIDKNASNGFADFLQSGANIAVRRLSKKPVNGSNVVFDALPDDVFKLVNTVSFVGSIDGTYTGFLNISPDMEVDEAVADETGVTIRIRYSQVRLTGHDFLDIGTGNFTETNYPGLPTQDPKQENETKAANGGRVFFTATDQDGNFRVGDLFSVEQATGVATLNAEAFNIAGLQELSLGEVTLGGNSASVNEFSTDPFFTANSDNVVPTQRAIKSYIEAQIGGGGASLNVNSVTAGSILIRTNEITTVDDSVININANMNFTKGVTGLPIAFNFFLR